MLHAQRKKICEGTTFDRRVNFVLMFFQEELVSLSSTGKKAKKSKFSMITPHKNTKFSKLLNLCSVKTFYLILTPAFNQVHWLSFPRMFFWSCSLSKPLSNCSITWQRWRSLWHPGQQDSQSRERFELYNNKVINWLTYSLKQKKLNVSQWTAGLTFLVMYLENCLQSRQRSQGQC